MTGTRKPQFGTFLYSSGIYCLFESCGKYILYHYHYWTKYSIVEVLSSVRGTDSQHARRHIEWRGQYEVVQDQHWSSSSSGLSWVQRLKDSNGFKPPTWATKTRETPEISSSWHQHPTTASPLLRRGSNNEALVMI